VQFVLLGIVTRVGKLSVFPPVTVITGHVRGERTRPVTTTFGTMSEKETPVTACELSLLNTREPATLEPIGTASGENVFVATRAPITVRLTGTTETDGVLLAMSVKLFGATPEVRPVTTA